MRRGLPRRLLYYGDPESVEIKGVRVSGLGIRLRDWGFGVLGTKRWLVVPYSCCFCRGCKIPSPEGCNLVEGAFR